MGATSCLASSLRVGVRSREVLWALEDLQHRLIAPQRMNPALITDAKRLPSVDDKRLSPHLRWELEEVMSRVRPDDLSIVEVAGLLAILVPAHSRVIGRPAGRPTLPVIRGRREHAPPDLAQ